jgi:dTDP-glucose 4,6-dehydratase/UDP-glucose 4-epimerase
MKHSENTLMKHLHYQFDISDDVQSILSRLCGSLEFFDNKRIFITGGTGFFGRWLLQILCTLVENKGLAIEIYVLSRNPQKFLSENSDFPFQKYIQFIQGDVVSFTLPDIELDYLIHMATTAAVETFAGEDQLKKLELLYSGTKNTLDQVVKREVKKVLFTSSGVVYGPSSSENYSEDILLAPQTTLTSSALGEGKRLAEYLVSYYAEKHAFDYSIARCFSFFGPFLPLDIHYAIGNFVNDAMVNSEITVKGSGLELRSYLYIADAWSWMLDTLIHADNQIYNVGSSKPLSIGELAYLVRDTLAPQKEVNILGATHDVGNFSRNSYVPNCSKIRNKFDLSEWTSLSQGIQKWAKGYSAE